MSELTKATIAAATLLVGLLLITIFVMAKGQKEVPDDRPHPSGSVSVGRR